MSETQSYKTVTFSDDDLTAVYFALHRRIMDLEADLARGDLTADGVKNTESMLQKYRSALARVLEVTQ